MRLLKYSLALLAFAACSNTIASSIDDDYDSDAYESGGNLIVKIRGCAIITEGDLKSLPSTTRSNINPAPANAPFNYNPNQHVNIKNGLKNGYGIENANTLFFTDHFATELSIGLSAYILPQSALQTIYNNYANGTPGNITTTTVTNAAAVGGAAVPILTTTNIRQNINNDQANPGAPVPAVDASGNPATQTNVTTGPYLPSYNTKRHLLMGIPLNLTLQYHIAPYGAIRPYVGIGGNFTYFTSKAKEYTVKPAYGMVLQAGVDIVMTDDTVISIDARYTKLAPKIRFKSSFLNGAEAVSSKMKMDPFVISAGIGFKL
ncbi:MAG: OmpW family protein [Rickettsiaceae bacterium]|nr:OmpW family protein [Rickettsiaceae bacterium]